MTTFYMQHGWFEKIVQNFYYQEHKHQTYKSQIAKEAEKLSVCIHVLTIWTRERGDNKTVEKNQAFLLIICSSWVGFSGRGRGGGDDDDTSASSWSWGCVGTAVALCLLVWYAEILFPLPSNITGSSSASGTHFSPRIMVFIQTESSAFNFGPFILSSLWSLWSQFLATDTLLGILMLRLNGALRSEVTLFILSEIKGSFGSCCNAGGRGNFSFSFSFSFSLLLSLSSEFDVGEVSDSLGSSVGSSVGGGVAGFLPNPLHKAVIMAMLAAKPAAKNDRYITGWWMNNRVSTGSLLPITNTKNDYCLLRFFLFCVSLPCLFCVHRTTISNMLRGLFSACTSPETRFNFRCQIPSFWVSSGRRKNRDKKA